MRGRWNRKTLWVVPLAALVVLAALPALAENTESIGRDQEIATMAIHGGSVSFAPQVSFDEVTLTVAGKGHVFAQSFRGGQTASFAPVDSEGMLLPDGTYKWELVTSPRGRDLNPRAFKNGEVSADGRTMEAALAPAGKRQSGVFTIKNGVMVDPNVVEAQSARAASAPRAAAPPSAADRAAEHTDRDN